MSSESIDLLWDESITELKRLVEEEESVDASKSASIPEAFHHFAKLYVRYSVILSKLEKCYDFSIQPQKRQDIKSSLEYVTLRVINLRHLVVKWAPPNSDVLVKDGDQPPFPWEFFDLGPVLRELRIPPSQLETTTPSFLNNDTFHDTHKRNVLVGSISEDKLEGRLRPVEEKTWVVVPLVACEAVENNESEANKKPERLREEVGYDDLPRHSATKIQTAVRGHLSRKKTHQDRVRVKDFVGMSNDGKTVDVIKIQSNLNDIHRKRKEEQNYCKESYEKDLDHLKDVVREEEGFKIQVELREERIKWITEHVVEKNSLPDSFDDFYAKDTSTAEKEIEIQQPDNPKGADKKSTGGDKKSKDKKAMEVTEIERPDLSTPPPLLESLKEIVNVYENRWKRRNVGPDRVKSQYHDAELAKELIVRDQVKLELTQGVEEKLLSNLIKIKAMQEAGEKKPKSKKEGNGQGKKGKGKKAGGGKKEKPLPGAKLPGFKEMGVEAMLSTLIEHGLVCIPAKHKLSDLIGGFQTEFPKFPGVEKQERWVPEDPSAFQLRRAIMDYCILPLGSESIKHNIQDSENVRSLLFYGPEGSGKTLMAQAVASEINALFINLSSSTIGNAFGGKEGASKLVHMIFTVAKEKSYAPVIIYVDNCHELFMGKSKRGGDSDGASGLQRFQKNFLIYKNQALKKDDRVIVIGCTSAPEKGDAKLFKWKGPNGKPEKQGFFERFLYFPKVHHSDRVVLWQEFIQRRLLQFNLKTKSPEIDWESLAILSSGFSAAEILSTVETVLSEERAKNISSEPLSEHEFSCFFYRRSVSEDERFLNFTRQITDLNSRWKSVNGNEQSGDAKKKKK